MVCAARLQAWLQRGAWKILITANWRNMLNLMQPSPGAHAADVILCGESWISESWWHGGGCGVEQASRPCKAKGMPGWIRIRGG